MCIIIHNDQMIKTKPIRLIENSKNQKYRRKITFIPLLYSHIKRVYIYV